MKVTALAGPVRQLLFPHEAQALQITRRRPTLGGDRKWSSETVYAATSLTARLTGVTNIVASTRFQARRPDRPVQVIKSL